MNQARRKRKKRGRRGSSSRQPVTMSPMMQARITGNQTMLGVPVTSAGHRSAPPARVAGGAKSAGPAVLLTVRVDNVIVVKWAPIEGAEYIVSREGQPDVVTTESTYSDDRGLQEGQTYVYVIHAIVPSGLSLPTTTTVEYTAGG